MGSGDVGGRGRGESVASSRGSTASPVRMRGDSQPPAPVAAPPPGRRRRAT